MHIGGGKKAVLSLTKCLTSRCQSFLSIVNTMYSYVRFW